MDKIRTKKLQIIVVGASGSGKTSLIRQAKGKQFNENQKSTQIVKLHHSVFTPVDEDGQEYEANIFDISCGQRSSLCKFGKLANVAIICFDLSKKDTLIETVQYLKVLKDYKCDIILAGTKSDKIMQYSRQDLDEFINDINGREIRIDITSSQDGTGIDQIFGLVLQKAIQNFKALQVDLKIKQNKFDNFLANDDDDSEDISQDLVLIEQKSKQTQKSKQANGDCRMIKKNKTALLTQLWAQLNCLQTEQEFHGIFYYPVELDRWIAYINGPFASPYEKGCFQIDLRFPEDYPYKPPIVRFETLIYHPNISQEDGIMSTSFLNSEWSPAINVRVLLLMIQAALDIDHQDQSAAQALIWTEDYAMPRKDESNLEELKQQFLNAFQPFVDLKYD